MTRRSPVVHNGRGNALQQKLERDYLRCFAQRDFASALGIVRRIRRLTAAPEAARAEALCLARTGKCEEAYVLAKSLPGEKLGLDYIDLMAEICGRLGRTEELQVYGDLALRRKDEEVAGEPYAPIPDRDPPPVSADRKRNVIAFSLFGDQPRYCEGAILNCQAAARLLPAWTCRFYCDATVPETLLGRLVENSGEVILVDEATRQRVHKLMWRFLVADDAGVVRFLVRDADSLIGEREQQAVQAWVASDRWFHLMRDWYTHTELLLAGMWGGCTGVLPNMQGNIVSFLRDGRYAASHVDQHFLRRRIWPTVRQSVLSHDSRFEFFNNQPFPSGDDPPSRELHVGANMGASQMSDTTDAPDGTLAQWTIYDENRREICTYPTVVKSGRWQEYIPIPYARKIKEGLWTVRVRRR